MTDLYKLTQDMQELELELKAATDPDTGAVDISDEKMGDLFRLEHATNDKIDDYVHLMENLDVKAEIRDAEYKALKKKFEKHRIAAKAAENRKDRLKDWMKLCMESAGKDKIETDHFTVRVQKNSQSKLIVPDNPDFKGWHEDLIEIKLEPNDIAIREWFAEKKELPEGVEVVTGTHIRIR